ncbi:membrane-bound alkaline phosphatase-like [Culicoides brevitarsis]|uniref:membrane-bound alkaline phosphatase-like n=1 Tax=Culicoides brevitarsis TaxID=469753 RepID=UPI00307B14BA
MFGTNLFSLKLLILSACFLTFVSSRAPDFHSHPEFRDSEPLKKNHEAEFNTDYWKTVGSKVLEENLKKQKTQKIAKNIILFLGDGLGVQTTSATRSYVGDPSISLAYEDFPYVGMSKTYCVDRQTADSACSATAYLCGVKANYETIGLNAKVQNKDCKAGQLEENRTPSIAKWAMDAGKAAGLVTTTRVTHASPTGVYGHIAFRDWENDEEVKKSGCDPKTTDDIAEQLIRDEVGSKLRVIMGGGRYNFRPVESMDEEGKPGKRLDGVDLIEEWKKSKNGKGNYVWNRQDLLKINATNTTTVLGLFEDGHTLYNLETIQLGRQDFEPTLTEMVDKAIDVLSTEEKGYFLFVEGGRIDHAHHENQAKLSLDETKEFAKAIQMTKEKVDLEETLIVVTADHSHAFSYGGYPGRDVDILGTNGQTANDGMESFILSYANGMGSYEHVKKEGGRVDPKSFAKPIFFQYPGMIPNELETHGGEDVGVYAIGPWSHLFTGNFQQFTIPHMMAYAACIGNGLKACDDDK